MNVGSEGHDGGGLRERNGSEFGWTPDDLRSAAEHRAHYQKSAEAHLPIVLSCHSCSCTETRRLHGSAFDALPLISRYGAVGTGATLRSDERRLRLPVKHDTNNALKIYPVAADVQKQHVARERNEYRERRDPAFVTYGPKTHGEFLAPGNWNA